MEETETGDRGGVQGVGREAGQGRPGHWCRAREPGISDQTLRNWVKAFEAGKDNGPEARTMTPDLLEMSRVRAGNVRLRKEKGILKKRRCTLRRMRHEVRLDRRTAQEL